MLNHNKKRNVGLLVDFFSKYIASSLVEQKHSNIEKAKKLYLKYFSGNTEIAKEAKIFNVMYTTNVGSKEIAYSLLNKIKTICEEERPNVKKLEDEKTRLLHEINNVLGDRNFFSREVSDYKLQGAIQVLLNSWRTKVLTENLGELANLESLVLEHLCSDKSSRSKENSSYLEMTNEEIDSFVVGIMAEKFNSKFSEELTEEQKNIISCYAFSDNPEKRKELFEGLENLRTKTLSLIENVVSEKKINKEEIPEQLSKKLTGIKNLLLNEYKDTTNINDENLTFYMTLVKLEKELNS